MDKNYIQLSGRWSVWWEPGILAPDSGKEEVGTKLHAVHVLLSHPLECPPGRGVKGRGVGGYCQQQPLHSPSPSSLMNVTPTETPSAVKTGRSGPMATDNGLIGYC